MANKILPQGYKESPLGIIPKEWEVKRLDTLFSFKNGINANKESYGDGIPFVNTMDVLNNTFLKTDVLRGKVNVSPKTKEEFCVVYGDVLFNRTSETREEVGCSSVYIDTEEAVFGGFVIRAHDISSNDFYDFFKGYCFQPFYIRSQIVSLGNGAIRYNLGQEDLSRVKILVPPIIEQQRIVSVLQLWDTAIEKQSELIEKLKLRKRALMQQLLTGKKRLPGFSGEWKRIKAGEIFESSSIRGNSNEVLLSATQEHGVIPRDQLEGRVTMPTGELNSFKLVGKGDFVISLRSFQGGLEYSQYRGIVSPAYTVLKPVKEIDKSFYRFYFKSSDFIGHLAIAVIGIRDGKQISYDDFCFVKIPYLNIEEQKAISAILLQSEKEIELANKKLNNLQSQKRGLMQQLLTGKKRIMQL